LLIIALPAQANRPNLEAYAAYSAMAIIKPLSKKKPIQQEWAFFYMEYCQL